MSILETLKRQAQAIRNQQDKLSDRPQSLEDFTRATVVDALKRLHDYLHELLEQVSVVSPDVVVEFPLMSIHTMTGLRQGGYDLVYECRPNSEVVILRFSLQNDEDYEIALDDEESAGEMLDELNRHGLMSSLSERQGAGNITVQGYVPVSLEFDADFATHTISFTSTNFSQLGSESLSITPEQVDEEFLDGLGKYLLRTEPGLMDKMRTRISAQSAVARTGAEGPLNQPELPLTQEMSVSQIKSLFSRSANLRLSYHNAIKEVSPTRSAFVIGRSEQCDLIVKSELASRIHARIVYRKGKFVLIDQSTNGTFVRTQGGKEVNIQREEYPLAGTGSISLGKSITVSNEHMIYYFCQ
jgi:hypothetical protein